MSTCESEHRFKVCFAETGMGVWLGNIPEGGSLVATGVVRICCTLGVEATTGPGNQPDSLRESCLMPD